MRKSAAACCCRTASASSFDGIVTGASEKGTWVRIFHPPVEGKVVHGADGLDIGAQGAGEADRRQRRARLHRLRAGALMIDDRAEVERLIAEHGRWWHEIELAPGIVTPGDDSNRMKLPILDALGLPLDLRGKRALDIGCSDGYFSFELEKRGAAVTAIDFVPETYTGFATARKILGSGVDYRMDNVYNLTPEGYGSFDVVLFLGVLYHLRKPLAALDAIRSVMQRGAQLFVGTMLIDEYFLLPDGSTTTLDAVNPLLKDVPLWQAYPGDTLNGDFTNCFAPNRRALEGGAGGGAVPRRRLPHRVDGRVRAGHGCFGFARGEIPASRLAPGDDAVRSGGAVFFG